MKPPECHICGREDECEIISFKKQPSDIDWERRMKEIGGVGHPPWQEWFCIDHAGIAKDFSHLPRPTAMKKINEALNS